MKSLLQLGAVILTATLACAMPAAAQNSNPENATLQALLAEVRQLRLVVEKSLALTPRMQVLLQRVQFQEQKVTRLQQQLDEVRKQIAGETARQTNAAERLAKIEQDISSAPEGERRQLEDMRAGLKMVIGNGPDPQLRARESEISNTLQGEQAILDDFNSKLDTIDRQLPH